MLELIPLFMFLCVCLVLMAGYPVAFTLAGVALLFAGGGIITGVFDPSFLIVFPSRVFGIMTNKTLMAVPLFILMGVVLEKSRVAENLLISMARLFGPLPGGLGISITLVGALLAASTGIVGATVVTMGLLSLPTLLKRGYSPALSSGIICATGTLGQIIPPSIALVLLGDVLSSAYQQAQLSMGIFNPKTVSVGDLFVGAIIPGLLMVGLYIAFLFLLALFKPQLSPAINRSEFEKEGQNQPLLQMVLRSLLPPLGLILLVLGSILTGKATPTEAAAVGAAGAILLALLQKQLSKEKIKQAVTNSTEVTAMVFMILIGASLFSLVFRGFGGDELVGDFFQQLPGGVITATIMVMVVIFLLGFILDFIEITFVVVPIVGPVLLAMGLDPIWLGIMIAINLQTSFLTPPFGFALFYLRGVAPSSIKTSDIYKGVTPFIAIQLLVLALLALFPQLATWLPTIVYQ